MNRTKIKNYAPQARQDFLTAVSDGAGLYGIRQQKVLDEKGRPKLDSNGKPTLVTVIDPVTAQGDVAIIAGRAFPREVLEKRKALQARVEREGYGPTIEALAYTWFNRLVAIRYMELRGYFEHGYRVLSNPDPTKTTPEILDRAEHVELPDLNRSRVIELKLDGTKEAELYRMLLVAQCNALHSAMPFLFERIGDETELVLPESLLHSDSIVRKLVSSIDEEDWQEVEIIGWLYEGYISERFEAVIGSVVASADIPAATQRFTPKWIVRYLVQNTLGRLWLGTYPQSPIKGQMKYYIEPAEQTPEVQEQLRAITPTSLNPEEITLLDPACGSAHILVEAYDLFKAIYQERGYRAKDIPRLILTRNLFGLEIDDRAAQLAAFALMMKARADDRRIFEQEVQPHVQALVQTDGMDAEDMAAALNVTATREMPSSGLLFETEDDLFTRAATSAIASLAIAMSDVKALIGLFEHAKTFGSLIQVPAALAARLTKIEQRCREVAGQTNEIASRTAVKFLPVIEQARMLAARYDCVAANPPYMGSKYYDASLKAFVNKHYKIAKADLYACFIERNAFFANQNGFVGMITIPNWMFLSSFQDFRFSFFARQIMDTLIHNGRGVFGSDFGSCSFVFRNVRLPTYRGLYRRLFHHAGDVSDNSDLARAYFDSPTYHCSIDEFSGIPGQVAAYWISKQVRQLFTITPRLSTSAKPVVGILTGNDDRYLRMWYEVDSSRIGWGLSNGEAAKQSCRKWFPFMKGGQFRRWYGNYEHLINWEDDGKEVKAYTLEKCGSVSKRIYNTSFFFRQGLTFSSVSIGIPSFRWMTTGNIISHVGQAVFSENCDLRGLLGYLNSTVATKFLSVISPTAHFESGQVRDLPFLPPPPHVYGFVDELVEYHRNDWDSFETSWDFKALPVLQVGDTTLQGSQDVADVACLDRCRRTSELEEENNRLFINAYGLQDELSPEVPDDQITLYRPNLEEDIKRLISYAVGCTMGRYSLDRPGLIYAHGGNVGFDPGQYRTFPADPDGIVPIMEGDWFADDATNRFVEFLGVAWPNEGLDENLKFVADSLGPSRGEQPRDTIRRYLATGFFKHHLQTYKRRPIYWLFSSGKQRAFQCLVYLHRYHDGTLARIRTEYVIPLEGKLASRIDQLAGDIPKATSTSHRNTLTKERDKLLKQQAELLAYDEKLRHYADMRPNLDLDDGVKVNYGKLGDLLAEVKAVTGGMEEA
jgi:hypothetical protein